MGDFYLQQKKKKILQHYLQVIFNISGLQPPKKIIPHTGDKAVLDHADSSTDTKKILLITS